ncbi:MAG: DUF424 family protein [Candidatus Diapherotrites archaeon]
MPSNGIWHRIHTHEKQHVLAAADEEIVGKTLREGKIVFHVSKEFYAKKAITMKKLKELLEEYDNINLVGERCIHAAREKGIIEKEGGIILLSGVPHAQVYKLNP